MKAAAAYTISNLIVATIWEKFFHFLVIESHWIKAKLSLIQLYFTTCWNVFLWIFKFTFSGVDRMISVARQSASEVLVSPVKRAHRSPATRKNLPSHSWISIVDKEIDRSICSENNLPAFFDAPGTWTEPGKLRFSSRRHNSTHE